MWHSTVNVGRRECRSPVPAVPSIRQRLVSPPLPRISSTVAQRRSLPFRPHPVDKLDPVISLATEKDTCANPVSLRRRPENKPTKIPLKTVELQLSTTVSEQDLCLQPNFLAESNDAFFHVLASLGFIHQHPVGSNRYKNVFVFRAPRESSVVIRTK